MEIFNTEIDDNIIIDIIHELFDTDSETDKDISDNSYIKEIIKNEEPLHYVDNIEFTELLKDYEKVRDLAISNNQKIPKAPDKLGFMIYKICNNLSRRYNFIGYTYRDEMVSDAIVSCLVALKTYKYKENQTSAFTYFTFIASYAMVRRIKKEKREQEKKINLVGDIFVKTAITQEVDNSNDFFNETRDSFYNIYSDR